MFSYESLGAFKKTNLELNNFRVNSGDTRWKEIAFEHF